MCFSPDMLRKTKIFLCIFVCCFFYLSVFCEQWVKIDMLLGREQDFFLFLSLSSQFPMSISFFLRNRLLTFLPLSLFPSIFRSSSPLSIFISCSCSYSYSVPYISISFWFLLPFFSALLFPPSAFPSLNTLPISYRECFHIFLRLLQGARRCQRQGGRPCAETNVPRSLLLSVRCSFFFSASVYLFCSLLGSRSSSPNSFPSSFFSHFLLFSSLFIPPFLFPICSPALYSFLSLPSHSLSFYFLLFVSLLSFSVTLSLSLSHSL